MNLIQKNTCAFSLLELLRIAHVLQYKTNILNIIQTKEGYEIDIKNKFDVPAISPQKSWVVFKVDVI